MCRTVILGISCFYHDAAAALLIDGVIVAAAQEERFTRVKHTEEFPRQAIEYCLKSQGITIADVDHIVFYDKPILKFERLLTTYIKNWPRGLVSFVMAMRLWLRKKLWIEHLIRKELGWKKPVLFTEHHYAHAASAYYPSLFTEAVVVTMDGVGEWDTATMGFARGNQIKLTKAIHFPDSLGLLYSALTYYLGFKVNSAEYKVMGLAPYGDPEKYYPQFQKLITVLPDGSFQLNRRYFAYEYGKTMTNSAFDELFDSPPRRPDSSLEQRHKDIAAALQKVTNEIVLKIVRYAKRTYHSDNLCLAGGVALNCVANGKILEEGIFNSLYIQPAAGDAGGAVGAACYVYYEMLGHLKQGSAMPTVYTGPEFSDDEIGSFLEKKTREYPAGLKYERLADGELLNRVARLIADNFVVGWFQGRMEFGPRALGNRSIIADARNKENWQRVNLKIKFRESFRPFAPSVLAEDAEKYFALRGHLSPYMLLVAPALTDTVPAVTHIDGSARIQTVTREENPRYHSLIEHFFSLTGCPVIINTSFNVRGEPIVCRPEEAFACFANTDIDYLALGNFLIAKKDNPHLVLPEETKRYLAKFKLD